MAQLHVLSASPGMCLQDWGRPGYLAQGLSRGGAMDGLALAEASALLKTPSDEALAIEMAGVGGRFRADGGDLLIALTGAPMQAKIDGRSVIWNGTHILPKGAELTIGTAQVGIYGYLSVKGLTAPEVMGARGAHLAAGLVGALHAGDQFTAQASGQGDGLTLPVEDRFQGGLIRVLPSVQISAFDAGTIARFEAGIFAKTQDANRMGARLDAGGDRFESEAGRTILSETIIPGDIQLVGTGEPYVLLGECQTAGGYPRIATVISADLVKVAQAAPGTTLRFAFIDRNAALAARKAVQVYRSALPARCQAAVRNPSDMADLLAHQLVGGMISAHDDENWG